MLATTHAVVSGAVGEQFANPYLAFLIGIFVHIVIDKVPHYWPKAKKAQFYVKAFDGIGCLVVLTTFYFLNLPNKPSLLAGAAGGIAVDLVLVILAGFWPWLYDTSVRNWHEFRQIHMDNPWYYSTDFGLIVLSLIMIWVLR